MPGCSKDSIGPKETPTKILKQISPLPLIRKKDSHRGTARKEAVILTYAENINDLQKKLKEKEENELKKQQNLVTKPKTKRT